MGESTLSEQSLSQEPALKQQDHTKTDHQPLAHPVLEPRLRWLEVLSGEIDLLKQLLALCSDHDAQAFRNETCIPAFHHSEYTRGRGPL